MILGSIDIRILSNTYTVYTQYNIYISTVKYVDLLVQGVLLIPTHSNNRTRLFALLFTFLWFTSVSIHNGYSSELFLGGHSCSTYFRPWTGPLFIFLTLATWLPESGCGILIMLRLEGGFLAVAKRITSTREKK